MDNNIILTFTEVLDKIIYKLRDRYPRYDIRFVNTTSNKTNLMVDNAVVHIFNPKFLEKEYEFLKNNENYIDIIFSIFNEEVEKYHKKQMKSIKSGRGSRGLSLQQIKEAIANTKSNRAAARYLNVAYNTYRKYAKMYIDDKTGKTLFEIHLNPRGLGVSKGYGPNMEGRFSLVDIFNGHHPEYSSNRLKKRLIRAGLMKEECSLCGFNERRITDNKVPLLLNYKDGNKNNKAFENLEFLCYNCYYLVVGDLFWRRKGEYSVAHNNGKKKKINIAAAADLSNNNEDKNS